MTRSGLCISKKLPRKRKDGMHIPACEKKCTEIITLKNRYARRSRLSEKALLGLVCLFAMDLDAAAIAATLGISRNTVNSYAHKLRLRMSEDALAVLPQSEGLGAGEAYFQLSPLWRKKILPPMLFGVINNQGRIFYRASARSCEDCPPDAPAGALSRGRERPVGPLA
jgi:hypothetical protein